MKTSFKKQVNEWLLTFKEVYEGHIGLEAFKRAVNNPQLHGHIHEILYKELYNFNPINLLKGSHMELTKSHIATVKDVVSMIGKKVSGHAQLKDCSSYSGLRDVIKRINGGQYTKTRIVCTEETLNGLAGKVNQKVYSSGISTKTTHRIAGKVLGRYSGAALHDAGMVGAKMGGIVSAGLEGVTSCYEWFKGRKSWKLALLDTARSGIKGAASGYAWTATSSFVTAGIVSGIKGTAIAATLGASTVTVGAVVLATAVAVGVGHCVWKIGDRLIG